MPHLLAALFTVLFGLILALVDVDHHREKYKSELESIKSELIEKNYAKYEVVNQKTGETKFVLIPIKSE